MSVLIATEGTTEWRNKVSDILNMINQNLVGNVILTRLTQHKKKVVIAPLDRGRAANIGDDNASTNPVKAADSAPQGASARQPPYWYRGRADIPATPNQDERYDMVPGLVGTGLGSDVIINFSPENIMDNRVFERRADTVLVHELVHALRIVQGVRNPIPTDNIKWMNEEEFLAVAITNVYMSAGGSTRLRGGYGDYDQKLDAPENTSSGFLTEANLKIFDKLAPSWGPVFTDLGLVTTAPFNPFREYLAKRMA